MESQGLPVEPLAGSLPPVYGGLVADFLPS